MNPWAASYCFRYDLQAVFPLQHVRGNFGRIQSALDEVKKFHKERCLSSKPPNPNENSIIQGLHEATAMFRRQAQSLLQVTLFFL